jgi:hypothetical protein
MFNVINADSGEVIVTFDNGAAAGRYVAECNGLFARTNAPTRYRIVRQAAAVVSDEWKARENARFDNGTYRYVPWCFEAWNNHNHFCHVSNEDSEKIAYTANTEDGAADKQTRTRPGRYLEQHYGNVLSQDEIRNWCARFTLENNKPKLLWANTADDIEQVYTSGPSSCMSKEPSWYNSPCHPVKTYGTGDFALAYMRSPDGSVSARAIVAPSRKVYSPRIYGDYERLRPLLLEAGYTCGNDEDDWEGLRLLRIPYRSTFVAPYFDHPMSCLRDDGKYLVVDSSGEIECHETNGLASNGYVCARCDDRCSETYTVSGEQWCQDCYESYSSYCAGCDESYDSDDMAGTDRHGSAYCNSCASDMTLCDCCNYLSEDTVETLENETYCEHCADQHLAQTDCGTYAQNPHNCECEICNPEDETCNQGELEV